jgi:hypothetical protein
MLQNNLYLNVSSNFNIFHSLNFGAEPMPYRFQNPQGTPPPDFDAVDISQAFSNKMVNPFFKTPVTPQGEPQTPIFCALAGNPVRFRMLHPDGLGGFPDDVWTIHGHVWAEEPFVTVGNVPSAVMGNNPNSEWFGARDGFGAGNHFDILLPSAGGTNKIPGDYLYKSFPIGEFPAGTWGLFRVNATPQQQAACTGGTIRPRALIAAPNVKPVMTPSPEPQKDPQERFEHRRPKKPKAEQEEQAPPQ